VRFSSYHVTREKLPLKPLANEKGHSNVFPSSDPFENLLQLFNQPNLRGIDLSLGRGKVEEVCAVNFQKLLLSARAWRPLHSE